MELIYRTIDGKEFNNEADACYHEQLILNEKVQMFDPQGTPTADPDYAMAIFLYGEDAADTFMKISNKTGIGTDGISSGDEGVYVWDSFEGTYKYIEVEALRAAYSALGVAIKARLVD